MKRENWIKWDLDSRLGWKMAGYVLDTGAQGYGAFVILVEMLYRAEGNRLPRTTQFMQNYASVCKCMQSDANDLLASMAHHGLIKMDAEWVWSPRVDEERETRKTAADALSKKRQVAANTRWNGPKPTPLPPVDKMQTDARASTVMQTHANDARGEESRLEEKREEKIQSVCVLDELSRARPREGPRPTNGAHGTLGGVDPRKLVEKLAATQKISGGGEEIKKAQEAEPPNVQPQPPPKSQPERFAENILCKPSGSEEWEKDNRFILAARRPMKKLPAIWLTEAEVIDTVEQFTKAGLTIAEVRAAIKSADGRLKTTMVNGRSQSQVSVYNWLIGWCLQDQLNIANAANKARRSAQ